MHPLTRPCNFSRYALISDDLSDEIKGQYTSTALTLKMRVQIQVVFQTSISANISVFTLCSDTDMDLKEVRWGGGGLE